MPNVQKTLKFYNPFAQKVYNYMYWLSDYYKVEHIFAIQINAFWTDTFTGYRQTELDSLLAMQFIKKKKKKKKNPGIGSIIIKYSLDPDQNWPSLLFVYAIKSLISLRKHAYSTK